MTDPDAAKKALTDMEVHKTLLIQLDQLLEESSLSQVRSELSRLLPDLEAHFEEEEARDGLFAKLREDAPESDPRVSELETEHKALLATLRELLSHVNEAVQLRAEVEDSLQAFTGRLRSHQGREEAIVKETYESDAN